MENAIDYIASFNYGQGKIAPFERGRNSLLWGLCRKSGDQRLSPATYNTLRQHSPLLFGSTTSYRRDAIPKEENIYFDDAYERVITLQQLELFKIDVNIFTAVHNSLINDGYGLCRGQLILPYEHLSRFQNDLID